MIIKYRYNFISITKFVDVDVERLSILTGVNGAGKTHLFKALKSGAVSYANFLPSEIIEFDYDTFKMENEQPTTSNWIIENKENAWLNLQNILPNIQTKPGFGAGHGVEVDKPLWDREGDDVAQYRTSISNFFEQHYINQQPWATPVFNYIRSLDRSVKEISREFFNSTFRPTQLKNDFLPQTLGAIIWDYYTRWMQK